MEENKPDPQAQITALEVRIAELERKAHDDHTISAEAVSKIAEQVKLRLIQDLLAVSRAAVIGVA